MGIYTINLGTSFGQKLHTFHMLVLPLIPVIIILAQNTTIFLQYVNDAKEMLAVRKQIAAAIDLSILVSQYTSVYHSLSVVCVYLSRPTQVCVYLQFCCFDHRSCLNVFLSL